MSVTTSTLVETTQLTNAETTVYTATVRTIIDKASSYGVAAADLTVRLIGTGGTAGATNITEKKTHAIGETYNWPSVVGHTLEVGDFISVLASAATSINLRISGRKIT